MIGMLILFVQMVRESIQEREKIIITFILIVWVCVRREEPAPYVLNNARIAE